MVALKRYFYHGEGLLDALKYTVKENEASLSVDSRSYSTDDPTFSYNEVWKEAEHTK